MATSCTRELLYTRAGVFPWWAASRPWHCGERAAAFQKAPSLGNADKTSAPDFALDFSCFAPKNQGDICSCNRSISKLLAQKEEQ